jgi:hypothetical protein
VARGVATDALGEFNFLGFRLSNRGRSL